MIFLKFMVLIVIEKIENRNKYTKIFVELLFYCFIVYCFIFYCFIFYCFIFYCFIGLLQYLKPKIL